MEADSTRDEGRTVALIGSGHQRRGRQLLGATGLATDDQHLGGRRLPRSTSAIDGRCKAGGAGSTTTAEVAREVFSDDATKEDAARQWQ